MVTLRQGDVFVEAVTALPDGAQKRITRERGRLVMASGEVTGHAHVITTPGVRLVACSDGVYVVSDVPFAITHEEHAPLTIMPGVYRVRIQREWTDENEPRPVFD